MSERRIESSTFDARYRADILLSTGKTVSLVSDWKPSQWDEVERGRRVLVRDAVARATEIRDAYGVLCAIRVYREERHSVRVTETTLTTKFDSEHLLAEVSS